MDTAARLEQAARNPAEFQAFVGLDGFVDEIFHVVDKRQDANTYKRLPTIAQFARRMAEAAGKSTNIELVSQRVKSPTSAISAIRPCTRSSRRSAGAPQCIPSPNPA